MRNHVFLRRGGEGVAPWVSLAAIIGVLALILTTLSFAPTASADQDDTVVQAVDAGSDQVDDPTGSTVATTDDSDGQPGAPAGSTTDTEVPASEEAAAHGEPVDEVDPFLPDALAEVIEPRAGPGLLAVNSGIEVEITEIVRVDGDADDQLEVGDSVSVSGTWDATAANPQAGDEFHIGFPPELEIPANFTFALFGDDGTVWGNCVVNADNTVTCTLTDAVEDRPEEVRGTFELISTATSYTTAEEVLFDLNDRTNVPVPLPGGGGIGDGQELGGPRKNGEFEGDRAGIRWTIDIPGAKLAALDPQGTGNVTLNDTLSDNMQLCEPARLDATLQSGRPDNLSNVTDGVSVTQPGGAGEDVIIEITNGEAFRADQLYRIQYTSCTTSGGVDVPAEGEEPEIYENSVTIGDETYASPGIVADWRPATGHSKSGTIHRNDSYQSITWTVMIPGSMIDNAADNTVTVEDTLGGDHEVCAEGLDLRIARSDYLPGNAARTNVTGDFELASSAASGSKEFSFTVKPKDPATFDAEKYYWVTYTTCVTSELLPERADEYTNTATIDGVDRSATVHGPNHVSSKKGTVNTSAREVNGEVQPAGTTIDWDIAITGRELEEVDDRLIITDTFSENMRVCEVGDSLKENLNLKVTRHYFIGATADHPDRDLTEDTEVDIVDGALQFTLPREEGVDYTRAWMYDISYTLCTASGGLDARGTTYENTVEYGGHSITQGTQQTWGGGGTGQGVSRGSFSLTKEISALSADFPEDTVFTVLVEEFAPGVDPTNGDPESTYNVRVKADGTPVSGFNSRGTGWTIRLTEIDLPHGNGVYFEPGTFRPAPGVELNEDRTQALITIQPQTNVTVQLENRAHEGAASITKNVEGNAVDALTGNERFQFTASIDPDGAGPAGARQEYFVLGAEETYNFSDLPIGSVVTFEETLPADTDEVTWGEPVFTPERLVIGPDPTENTVVVTNTANATEGSLTVSKELTGPEAFNPNVPASFEVIASWVDADGAEQERVLDVPADGSAVALGVDLPGGTEVTLTEVVPEDGNGLAWGVPAFSGDVTASEGNSAVVTVGLDSREVTVTNFVELNDGTLRVTKQVNGEGAEYVGADTEFTVEARWNDGSEFQTRELTVRPGESTPLEVDLPVGTEVTFRELERPSINGVEWGEISWGTNDGNAAWLTPNQDGTATAIVSDETEEGRLITLTNTAELAVGTFSVEKSIDPLPEGFPVEETVFTVNVEEFALGADPAVDEPVAEYPLLVRADGTPVNGENDLVEGSVVRLTEVDLPQNAGGFYFEAGVFRPAEGVELNEDGTVALVTVARDTNIALELVNTPLRGEATITKEVSGDAAGDLTGDEDFVITASIDEDGDPETPAEERTFTLRDGQFYGLDELPIGATVTFEETLPADTDLVTWGEPVFTPNVLVIDPDRTENTVVVTNTANVTEGSLTVSKALTGPEASDPNVPETFQVIASWVDADGVEQERVLDVPADGTAVALGVDLPGGTEVTLTEVVPTADNNLAWGVPAFSGDVTSTEGNSAVVTVGLDTREVTVTNYVEASDGTLRVTKQINGEAAEAIGDDAEFTVVASWNTGDGEETRELTVRPGESTPLGVDLPIGTEVTFTESERPSIDGVEWGEIDWGTTGAGRQWLTVHPDNSATGTISDNSAEGRLITLTNEARWSSGGVTFEKYILDGDDPVPARDADLPEGTEFQIRIDSVDPALPADVDFPAEGDVITLNAGNDWTWTSGDVLPRGTVITFTEVDPAPQAGLDWARPFYYVASDAGEPGYRNTVTVEAAGTADVEIHNRPIETVEVDIDKTVTGPKGGQVEADETTRFQVTATWTDADDQQRSCVLDVVPGESVVPTTACDATVVDGAVRFPLNTEITFVETGATTGVTNVKWGDVLWTVADGQADVTEIEGEPTGATVTLTGDADEPVVLGLENQTSSNGLIFIPIPIPLPPFDGSSVPPVPGTPVDPADPVDPAVPVDPVDPVSPATPVDPADPVDPVSPAGPASPETPALEGKPGAPGQPAKESASAQGGGLAETGANVAWLAGVALLLVIAGVWLTLRGRRKDS